jgi:DNA-binding CsgD family transcriptional regulator
MSISLDKKIVEQMYFSKNMSQGEIARKLGISQTTVWLFFKENNLTAKRSWRKCEIEYLYENWGYKEIKHIAKYTNKTISAVRMKAYRLGLRNVLQATEYLNATELARLIGLDTGRVIKEIECKNLKATFKQLNARKSYYRIKIEHFWKWAEKNQKRIRWDKFEPGTLGKEPKWVEETRAKANLLPVKRQLLWTNEDDKKLIYYWNSDMETKKIARILKRSVIAVRRKAKSLKLKKRRITIPWKPIEVEMLIEMNKQGKTDEEIAYELGRSYGSVNSKREHLKKEGKFKI